MCGEADEMEVASGEIPPGKDDGFLKFPGRMNGIAFKPLIDTGGACNLISAELVDRHLQRLQMDSSSPSLSTRRFKTLVMADGTESEKCPCIQVAWSFDGRNKKWTNVEFVVVKGYQHDVLIGLPFLKHSQTIHNSAGSLVFPEYKRAHTDPDRVPIYNFGEVKAST